MKKRLWICAMLATVVMFSACGGDSSSNDDSLGEFPVPDLHPENYPAVNTSTDEYAASSEMLDEVEDIYEIVIDSAMGSSVSKVIRQEVGNELKKMSIRRSSSGNNKYDLSYSGKGYTVTGSAVMTSSGPNECPFSYLILMKVVFTNYAVTTYKGSSVCSGTMEYKSRGTRTTENSFVDTTYVTADLSVLMNSVTHSVKFDNVHDSSATNGAGTFTDKTVYTIDGSQYGYKLEGKVVVDGEDEEDNEGK